MKERYGHDHLTSDRADLDLDVDNAQRFRANVDLDEAGVHRLVELAEPRDQAHRSCRANTTRISATERSEGGHSGGSCTGREGGCCGT